MRARDPQTDLFHTAVMWYGTAFLPRLRQMTGDQRERVLDEANEANARDPLHMIHRPTFSIPSWSKEKLTGGQVTALLVFGLWVQTGEDEGMAHCLISDWPEIRMACFFAPQGSAL